jgi:NAD-dependent deacetylase sirtuin 4
MVRISIPTIKPHPHPLPPSALTLLPVKEAAQHLSEFLAAGKGETLVLSGAGVSVDSGIRAYRGKEGQYSNPNYTYACVLGGSCGKRD